MKLTISHFAQLQITQTAVYLQWRNGKESMRKFLAAVRRTKRLLRQNPNLGPIEPLLKDLPKCYRSIVVTPFNKMIYTIVDDTIVVLDFWDTRRDPYMLAKEIK